MGTFQAALFIIGTSIGAGFISGAELVRFFHTKYFFLPVIISEVFFFAMTLLFMRLGKKYGGYKNTLQALFGRGAGAVYAILILVSFIPCAGMLAGLDALVPSMSPLPSILGLVIVLLFLKRGMKGISVLNSILVPVLLLFVFFARGQGVLGFSFPIQLTAVAGGALYAGMNVFLAAPVLMEAGKEMKRLASPALLAAAVIAVSAICVLSKIYGEGQSAIEAELPFLYVMRGQKSFYIAAALAILTSLASSLYPLLTMCDSLKGKSKNAAKGMVLLAAFGLSRLGLSGIVGALYPLIGGGGIFLSVVCFLYNQLLEKNNEKVHSRRKQTKNKRGSHHKIQLKHLPAVDDEVSKPRLGDDIFTHDRADPRHTHAHLQHGYKSGAS